MNEQLEAISRIETVISNRLATLRNDIEKQIKDAERYEDGNNIERMRIILSRLDQQEKSILFATREEWEAVYKQVVSLRKDGLL